MVTRRELAGALLPVRLAAALPEVTVTGLEVFRIAVNRRGDWVLARLRTSAGLTGLGDASHGNRDQETVRYLHQFFEILRGGGRPAVVAFGEVPWRAGLIDPPEALENGILRLAGRPGFGVRLNEKVARRYAAS